MLKHSDTWNLLRSSYSVIKVILETGTKVDWLKLQVEQLQNLPKNLNQFENRAKFGLTHGIFNKYA